MSYYYEEKAKTAQKLLKFEKSLEENVGDLELRKLPQKIVIRIYDLDKLTEARKLARKAYPDWKDSLAQIWASSDDAFCSWEDPKQPSIEIWLKTKRSDFPKELLGPNCRFEKHSETYESYALVCGKN